MNARPLREGPSLLVETVAPVRGPTGPLPAGDAPIFTLRLSALPFDVILEGLGHYADAIASNPDDYSPAQRALVSVLLDSLTGFRHGR